MRYLAETPILFRVSGCTMDSCYKYLGIWLDSKLNWINMYEKHLNAYRAFRLCKVSLAGVVGENECNNSIVRSTILESADMMLSDEILSVFRYEVLG